MCKKSLIRMILNRGINISIMTVFWACPFAVLFRYRSIKHQTVGLSALALFVAEPDNKKELKQTATIPHAKTPINTTI